VSFVRNADKNEAAGAADAARAGKSAFVVEQQGVASIERPVYDHRRGAPDYDPDYLAKGSTNVPKWHSIPIST